MGEYKEFLKSAGNNFSKASCKSIALALRIAVRLLRGQKRYDGSHFVGHSIAVARIVMEDIGLGRNSTIAALLHDASRLGLISNKEVKDLFGDAPLGILAGMNNISSVDPKTSTLQADNFKELIISYSTDPRVILLKMADRLEVMRSLGSFPELKRYKKSWETIHLYAPMAHKLGLYGIKSEMEDLSLCYLEPKDYQSIIKNLSDSQDERERFIKEFSQPIADKLTKLGINFKLKSRTKSVYSIWKKMQKQKVSFHEVFDIFAIRIIIDCPLEFEKMQCWTAFSVVTDFYTPNPERMRDWISIPKSNGYESLHATVVTGQGKWVEVQIRTQRMDDVAERGLAAHWRYKGVAGGAVSSEEWFSRLRSIVESSATDEPLREEFDISRSSSEAFVFTPGGDLRKLQEGATVLDFAFDIHSNIGATCTGGRINGRNVPLKEVLHSGDIVEIITSKSQRPKADWLAIAVTSKARNKIRQVLREEQAKRANLGREELERKLKNWKLPLTIDEAVTYLVKYFKLKTGLEVYSLISEQAVAMAEVKELLARYAENPVEAPQIPKPRKTPSAQKKEGKLADTLVIDDSLQGLAYKFAKCCNPIYGDPVFGFVTINSGITVHRADCPNAPRLREQCKYRIINVDWRENLESGAFVAQLRILGQDRSGIATEITDMLHRLKVNIRLITFSANGATLEGRLSVEIKNSQLLDTLLHNLKSIKGITSVTRVLKN